MEDGDALFNKLNVVVERYLDIPLTYLGAVPKDDKLQDAVMQQMPVALQNPNAKSARAFEGMAAQLMNIELNRDIKKRGMAAFFSHLMTKK